MRARPRDDYDLWRILRAYPEVLAAAGFADLLEDKCASKVVSFAGPDSFFVEVMTQAVERNGSSWMAPLVAEELPGWERVRSELQPLVIRLLFLIVPERIRFWHTMGTLFPPGPQDHLVQTP